MTHWRPNEPASPHPNICQTSARGRDTRPAGPDAGRPGLPDDGRVLTQCSGILPPSPNHDPCPQNHTFNCPHQKLALYEGVGHAFHGLPIITNPHFYDFMVGTIYNIHKIFEYLAP